MSCTTEAHYKTLQHLRLVLPYAEAELESLANALRNEGDPEVKADLMEEVEAAEKAVNDARQHLEDHA